MLRSEKSKTSCGIFGQKFPRRLTVVGASGRFLLGTLLISSVLLVACSGSATTGSPPPTQTALTTTGAPDQSTNTTITPVNASSTPVQTTLSTTIVPSQTSNDATAAPPYTGSGDMFVIDWPSNGESSPYLTFYNSMRYTFQHLWVKAESNNTVRIGFTDYGQRAIGQFLTLILPPVGTVLNRDLLFGFVEGGYMSYNLTAPVSGTVVQTNKDILEGYNVINQSPYDAGWLIVVQMSNPADLLLLLTASFYAYHCCPACHCDN